MIIITNHCHSLSGGLLDYCLIKTPMESSVKLEHHRY